MAQFFVFYFASKFGADGHFKFLDKVLAEFFIFGYICKHRNIFVTRICQQKYL